jgi:predicted DNA-binding protein with PD1-like motif
MHGSSYKVGRVFLCRLKHNSELLRSILDFAKGKKLKMAVFTVIGAVKQANISHYDQDKHEYQRIDLNRPLEIAGCFGNISPKDGKPFAHAHAVLSDPTGRTYGGHLIRATVFAAEAHIQELLGEGLEREYDDVTGLALWKFEGRRDDLPTKNVRIVRQKR